MSGSVAAKRAGLLGNRMDFWTIASAITIIFFALLLIYPIVKLIVGSIAGNDVDIVDVYSQILTKRYYYQSILNSFILSIAATAISVALGVPLAYLVSRYNIRGKLVVRAAIILTFVCPSFVGAYAWITLFGTNGIVTNTLGGIGIAVPSIYGWTGTILVLSLHGMSFVFLMVSSGLKTVDQSVEDAALNLGRSPIGVITSVIVPLIAPALSTGTLLAFISAFTDLGTPAVIGQNLSVLPRRVYSEFINEHGGDYAMASALSVILLLVTTGALLLHRWYVRRHSFGLETVKPLGSRNLTGWMKVAAPVYVYGVVAAATIPLVTVVISSFLVNERGRVGSVFSLQGYLHTPRLTSSLINTVMISTVATVICVMLGTLVGYVVSRRQTRMSSVIDVLSMMPFAVSGIVLGIAFSMAFGSSPFFLAGTAAILILVYVVRRLPFSVRSSASMLSQVGTHTEEASVNLGVPPGRTLLKITVPIIAPGILSGALLTWATVIKEFNATVILYGASTSTMSVEVFQQVLGGNFGAAAVVATVLILASLLPIIILLLFMGKDEDVLV